MSKNSKDIVFVAAQRSAIGRYKGIYKDLQAHNLGSLVIKSLIQKTKLKEDMIDEVILGQVLTGSCGQNPARQAAINSGIPKEKTAIIINQVCGVWTKIYCQRISIVNNKFCKLYNCRWPRKYD